MPGSLKTQVMRLRIKCVLFNWLCRLVVQ